MRILVQSGETRLAALPDAPTARELTGNDDDLALLALGTASSKMTFPYMMGPGVPVERVEAMRRAFMETFADPEFLADAAKMKLEIIEPLNGAALTAVVARLMATPADIVEKTKAAIVPKR